MSSGNDIVKLSSWRWRSPILQAAFTSSICACTGGLYVAINGLGGIPFYSQFPSSSILTRLGAGGGKPTSQAVASQTNAANDACWVFSSLVGGALLNRFGPSRVLSFGAAGFPLYLAGFWIYDQTGVAWVPPFMGSLSGLAGGALWAVQNWVATAYPTEQEKGLFIWLNWSVSFPSDLLITI